MADNKNKDEKMVNLNEDSKTHKHDDAEFERLKRSQETNKHK